jgi:hypothetical protein
MPASKKPRKAKKTRTVGLPLTIRHNSDSETALQLGPHAELMKLREGFGEEQSWHTIVARLNIGVVAANQNNKDSSVIGAGLDAMLGVQARHEKTGKYGISGQELRNVGDALVATDNLQLSLTRKQFAKAIDYVFKTTAID